MCRLRRRRPGAWHPAQGQVGGDLQGVSCQCDAPGRVIAVGAVPDRDGNVRLLGPETMSVERAAELMAIARTGVALTGAGISAESGIPTFRGAGGLWSQYDPVKVASIDNFLQDPSAYWKVAKERGPAVLAARPNPGHNALAALERAGRLIAVVTQNTDGLHQDAGSGRVIELHGSGRTVQCLDCGSRESHAEVQAPLDVEMPPRCKVCGGIFLKPTVVLFGEAMPVPAVEEAFALARAADVMLVVGS